MWRCGCRRSRCVSHCVCGWRRWERCCAGGRRVSSVESFQPPKLRFLHSENTMSPVKLEMMRRLSTEVLRSSLVPGRPGALKVRPNGTVLDGHHRLCVLRERGEDINVLPREIMNQEL